MQKEKQKTNTESIVENSVLSNQKNKGITLIALIITIVVMLILVCVTVNVAISGGLFKTAKQATTDTQKAIDAEQLQTVVLGIMDANTGKVDLEKLQEELVDWEVNKDNRKCTSPSGNKFIVGDYGNIKEMKWEQKEDGSITDGRVTLQIGDYVNYEEIVKKNPVTVTSESKVMKNLQTYSGYTGTNYEAEYPLTQETELKWRVLDVKDGNLRLISEKPTTSKVYLNGYDGYNNAVYLLDEICDKLYTTPKGATQNLKIEDIQDAMDLKVWDYHNYTNGNVNTVKYGETKEDNRHRYYPEIFAKEKTGWVDDKQGTAYDLSDQDKPIKQTEVKIAESKIKITQTYWNRTMQESDWKNKTYHNIFMKDVNDSLNYEAYWLSSRCVSTNPNSADVHFRVHYVYSGYVDGRVLYLSDNNYKNNGESGVRPVVTLSSDIQIGDKVGNTCK